MQWRHGALCRLSFAPALKKGRSGLHAEKIKEDERASKMETASARGGPNSLLDDFTVAEDDASALLSKLISLGYLCSDNGGDSEGRQPPLLPLGEPDEDTLETTWQAKQCLAKRRKDAHFNPNDANDCCVVLVQGDAGGCITRGQLIRDVEASLYSTKFNGRASLSDLAKHHGVDVGAVDVAVSSGAYLRVHDEIISTNHLDVLLEKISEMLEQNDGHLPIAALAADVCNLPLDVCLNSVLSKERLLQLSSLLGNETTVRIANLHSLDGSGMATRRELVTSAYDHERAKRMKEKLESAQEPVPLGPIIQDLMWDDAEALERIVKLCGNADGDEALDGTVKGVRDSATYVPNSYLKKQRRSVEEYFRSNGYITVPFITSLGMTMGADKLSFVRDCCGQNDLDDNNIVELPNSVVSAKDIISPLEGLIEEANSLRSFMDFRSILPETLLSHEDDIRELLEDIVPARLSEDVGFSKGIVVICDGGALYCSAGMAKDMESKILIPLIEAYGTQRAKKIDEAKAAASRKTKMLPDAGEDGDIIPTGAKVKKKSKKSNRREDDDTLPCVDESPGIAPLEDVVAALIKEYPTLAEIQENGVPHLADDEILWDPEDGCNGTGLVFELCRVVFGPSKVAKKCARAVKLELDKIESTKQGISLGGRRAGALKAASIEESFEATFADACYLVQLLAKLPQLLKGSDVGDDESVAKLQGDFLLGCASDFARRLTMFALYKHQVDEGIFVFEPRANSSDSPDVAVRAFPRMLLSCTTKDDGSSREPLATLREVLPGSVGVELARLWKCLPGDVTDDPYVRPGSMDDFLKQAEESCLIICGLPYKKINKKAEKKILFERRKQLTALLEASSDPIEILQYTIILLYQQIKSIAVAGDELLGAVLDMLCNEKKINDAVKQTLFEMRDQVVQQKADDELMNAVRAYGLSRDITSQES